jgi:hypothetical protein
VLEEKDVYSWPKIRTLGLLTIPLAQVSKRLDSKHLFG